jgi:hypothetical protein
MNTWTPHSAVLLYVFALCLPSRRLRRPPGGWATFHPPSRSGCCVAVDGPPHLVRAGRRSGKFSAEGSTRASGGFSERGIVGRTLRLSPSGSSLAVPSGQLSSVEGRGFSRRRERAERVQPGSASHGVGFAGARSQAAGFGRFAPSSVRSAPAPPGHTVRSCARTGWPGGS